MTYCIDIYKNSFINYILKCVKCTNMQKLDLFYLYLKSKFDIASGTFYTKDVTSVCINVRQSNTCIYMYESQSYSLIGL